MRYLVLPVLLLGLAPLMLAGAGWAQDADMKPLVDRLDRLERDMNQLQRQVYRGAAPGSAPVPAASGEASTALNTELRLDQLEANMRQLTGQLEEANYSVDQLKNRLDKLESDVDMRLTALEHGGAATAVGTAAGGLTAGHPPAAPSATNPGSPTSRTGVLVAPPGAVPLGGNPAAAAPAAAGVLPSGSAQEQYNYAFGLLRQANSSGDYAAAQQAFQAFLQRYPKNPLAGNAQYWMAETFYARKDYAAAAAGFAEGYRRYPQGGKAADSLLKLGMSLGNAGQKKEACLSFAQLAKDFPNAPANVKQIAAEQKQRLGC